MSLKHIALGVAAGLAGLSASLVLSSWLPIHPLWGVFALLLVATAAYALPLEKQRRLALRKYWDRGCTGRRWVKRFPDASTMSIRQFLKIVAAAFMFPGRHLKFSPDDRVLDIYRAIYPDRSMPDALELETLVRLIAKEYGIDIVSTWRDEITLGELYAQATAP